MQGTQYTNFNCDHINHLLSGYHQQSDQINLPKKVANYEDFCHQFPILRDTGLKQLVNDFLRLGLLNGCTFVTSSATSGTSKLMAQRLGRVVMPTADNYPYQLVKTLSQSNMFNSTDIVANLFSAGGMSTLFDNSNRLLEMCGASILPVGRLDAFAHTQLSYLQWMVALSTNAIFGTPSSVIQCANALRDNGLALDIKKVVFGGESFTKVKREYTRQMFPNMRVYGIYGQTETGVVGFHTPECDDDTYHLLTDFFFFEITAEGEILITDLTMPAVPLFRYYIGDIGEFKTETCSCQKQTVTLLLKGRCDKKFNYMGNLVSYEKIKQLISSVYGKRLDVQIQLSSDQRGNDLLTIIVDDDEANLNTMRDGLMHALCSADEINEGIQKGVGKINLCSRDLFSISHRLKMPLIHDNRSKETVVHYAEEEPATV